MQSGQPALRFQQSPTLTIVNRASIPPPMANPEPTLTNSLNAIVDPTRRRILHSLKQRGATSLGKSAGLCAGDIEERVRLSQPTISHHMAILTKAGLVEAKKQGQWRWYRRNEPAIRRLVKMLRAEL